MANHEVPGASTPSSLEKDRQAEAVAYFEDGEDNIAFDRMLAVVGYGPIIVKYAMQDNQKDNILKCVREYIAASKDSRGQGPTLQVQANKNLSEILKQYI